MAFGAGSFAALRMTGTGTAGALSRENSIMPAHDFEEYLQFLAAVLRVRKPRQEEIFSELRDHFAERVAELESEGADRERAAAVAQQEFGDAAALAAQFVEVIRQRKRRMVMRSTVGVISAALVGVMAALAFWPGGRGLSSLVAEEKTQKAEAAGKFSTAALLASAERDAATREKLAKPAEAEFVDQPLNSVIEYFKDYCKVQIYVKKRNVEEQGFDPSTATVNISLKGVPTSRMLQLILENFKLDYTIQDGVVIISTPEDLESQEQLAVKVYDLRNWLGIAPSNKEVDRLIDVVTKTIYPQSWTEVGGVGSIESLAAPKPRGPQMRGAMGPPGAGAGGAPGGARPPMAVSTESSESDSSAGAAGNFQGMIVVCQSSKVHERIGNLLDQLHVALKQKGGE
jgi:hypothetical protein